MNRGLIDQLRALKPAPDVRPARIEDVWRKVDRGAEHDTNITALVPGRRARRRSRVSQRPNGNGRVLIADGAAHPMRGGSRVTTGAVSRAGVGIALTGSVAIAVAVIAIVLVGHTHRPLTSGASTNSTLGLSAELSILRRPQTHADRLRLRPAFRRQLNLVSRLTRLAAVAKASPTTHVKLYVIVMGRPTPGSPRSELEPAQSGDQAAVLVAFLDARGAERQAGVAGGQSSASLRDPGAISSDNGFRTSLVPDGVTRVSWVFQSVPPRRSRPSIAITAQVNNNVAFAHVGSVGPLLKATWYGASGAIIAVYNASG